MLNRFHYSLLILLMLGACLPSLAQSNNPYHINGSASQENCNCYTLTRDENNQSGSVWNINKIDLRQSFEFRFDVYLGCRDTDGADGLVFVLQPISTSIGSTGGGLGYQGINPSIGIAIDTWQNSNDNDPFYDHLAIHRNGDINHQSANNLAGPVMASNINIEDCQWHTFHIKWDVAARKLSAEIDGKDRVETTINLVDDVFGGDPMVYWGFTGSTGGSKNHQRFCTSLTPGIASFDGKVTCYPTPIQFSDSSSSFGSIVKWYWDFGDGSTDSVQTPAPHVYPAPGIYNVKLNILGNNGCVSDTFRRQITVGSEPVSRFGYTAPKLCEDESITFLDSSVVQYGTINNRIWQVNNNPPVPTGLNSFFVQSFDAGSHQVALTVQTREGCISQPYTEQLSVLPGPAIDISVTDACFNEPVQFNASNLDASLQVSKWYWNLGDGRSDSSGASLVHTYSKGGSYEVQLRALGANGCISDTLKRTINIYASNAYAGRDTIVAAGQPVQLNGTGGVLYQWTPATGLTNPDIPNPVAIVEANTRYILTAYAPTGCATTDTITIKVYKGPAIYVPNAFTPNGDGRNDRFRFIPVGMKELYYFRVFNRYGQLVHSSTDPSKGWDGTLNGKKQEAGAYVWMVSGKDFNDKPHVLKGTVVLVR